MLPATAPFYMGLAAGWAVFLSNYIQHTGARMSLPSNAHPEDHSYFASA